MRFFNRVTLRTPESVELEFTLAGIGNRAYALLIDYVVWGFILFILLLVWLLIYLQFLDNFLGAAGDGFFQYLLAIQILLIYAVYVGYFVFFEVYWQGQTPGKRYVKIRVIRDDGRPVSLQQATLRALLRSVDDFLFLGVFFITLSKKEKRIGDLVAGTLVIQEEQGFSNDEVVLSEVAEKLASQLPTQTDLTLLQPENFAVIREYLQRRERMTTAAKKKVSLEIAHQVRDIIDLERVPQGITANQFLEAVYLAYQQQEDSFRF